MISTLRGRLYAQRCARRLRARHLYVRGRYAVGFRKGSGPAVIVIAEMPGITPKVLNFARKVADIGCTVVLPHLFGQPRFDPNQSTLAAVSSMARAMVPTCISREFVTLATGRTSPVINWLRALASAEHDRCGGPGVGAVGMCMTGGFALAMATDDVLLASVLSQPSMPFPPTARQKNAIDISDADMALVKQRCAAGLTVLGLRFKSDRMVPAERFDFLREQLGDAFVAVELDDADANPDALLAPHSVLTEHLIPMRTERSTQFRVLGYDTAFESGPEPAAGLSDALKTSSRVLSRFSTRETGG